MAKLSENLNLQVPEPMDTVNRAYFEKLILDIDEKVASQEDLEKALDGSAIASKTVTEESYKGSRKNVESALSAITKALDEGVKSSTTLANQAIADLSKHKPVVATNSTQGHVKLSDSTNSPTDVSGGTAATPKAVQTVNTKISDLGVQQTTLNRRMDDVTKRLEEVESGGVTLSSSTTSTSTTTGANSFAVKKAMDRADSAYSRANSAYSRADQAFQAGNDAKRNMVSAIKSVNSDSNVTTSSTWNVVADEVRKLDKVATKTVTIREGETSVYVGSQVLTIETASAGRFLRRYSANSWFLADENEPQTLMLRLDSDGTLRVVEAGLPRSVSLKVFFS